jgi:hypothetical protein
MVEEIEVITLVGGLVVLGFMIWDRAVLSRRPHAHLLMGAYVCFLAGWGMSVLESFILPDLINLAEHLLYVAGSSLMALWGLRLVRGGQPWPRT